MWGESRPDLFRLPSCLLIPNAKPEDLVKIGDEMDLLIMRTNDQEGTIMLSKKRLDAIKGLGRDRGCRGKPATILTGVVTEDDQGRRDRCDQRRARVYPRFPGNGFPR